MSTSRRTISHSPSVCATNVTKHTKYGIWVRTPRCRRPSALHWARAIILPSPSFALAMCAGPRQPRVSPLNGSYHISTKSTNVCNYRFNYAIWLRSSSRAKRCLAVASLVATAAVALARATICCPLTPVYPRQSPSGWGQMGPPIH